MEVALSESKSNESNEPSTTYVLTVTGTMGENRQMTQRWKCEEGVGVNVTEITEIDDHGHLRIRQRIEYGSRSGVVVPSLVSRSIHDPDGVSRFERVVTFTVSDVNMPLPADAFTYDELGLEDGDRMIDRVNKREFTFQQGELMPFKP